MSQSGIIKVESNILPPDVPTSFVADVGVAVPSGHVLNIIGGTDISTTGSGDTITISFTGSSGVVTSVTGTNGVTASPTTGAVIVSGVNATTTSVGVASFNATEFSVDGSGKVTSNNFTISPGTGLTGGGSITLGGSVTLSVNGAVVGQTITGNSGGALSPTLGNWNILGASIVAGTSPVTTSGSASTLTVSVQKSQAIASTDATKVGLASFNSADFTVDANGFVSSSGTGLLNTLTGNSGGAISPTAGNINTLGTGSITISGSGSTLTTQLTGLTNHAIQIGAGTATLTQLSIGSTGQVLQANSAADPTWSTATYPSTATSAGTILRADGTNWVTTTATYPATTTINQILYSSSNNVVVGLATANNGVLTTGTSGIPVITALASNGQLIIGSGSGAPAAATLSQGTGITITNAANSITIAVTNPSGFPWTDVTTATQTLSVNNGYITDHSTTVTYTLPSTAALGDTIKIVGKLGLATITPNANQQILIGSASGTVGATGTAVSNNVGDCIELICITAGASTVWRAGNLVGTWTLN